MLTIAKAATFEQVQRFYHELIDDMQSSPYKPHWEKGIYPSDTYLSEAVGRGELYLGLWDGVPAAAMVVNHACNGEYQTARWNVEADASQVMVIHTLGVKPRFGGMGLAKAMVQEAIRIARRAGQKAVRLDVLSGNVPALRLYEGQGFQYVTTVRMFYEDTDWTDFLLYEYVI